VDRRVADLPVLGAGLGLRPEVDELARTPGAVDWVEVISEHYLVRTKERVEEAVELARLVPVIPHGIELSIGTEGELDLAYVEALAEFVALVDAPWCSDHLCFTKAGDVSLGQLGPLVRTRSAAAAIGAKAQRVQDMVGVPFLLENITYYVDLGGELSDAEFLNEVMEHCECGLLLDLTNVYTNGVNHGFDPEGYLDTVPLERVVQIHLAGGDPSPVALLDSHGAPVPEEVWGLLDYVVPRAPNLKGVMIERDQHFPDDLTELLDEIDRARGVLSGVAR
jgi:uncharacterized protein